MPFGRIYAEEYEKPAKKEGVADAPESLPPTELLQKEVREQLLELAKLKKNLPSLGMGAQKYGEQTIKKINGLLEEVADGGYSKLADAQRLFEEEGGQLDIWFSVILYKGAI